MQEIGGPVRNATPLELKEAGIRPTGKELFDSLSQAEQDALIGPEKAQLIRDGEATLSDFVQHDGNFITRKPIEAVKAWNESDHPRGGDPKNPGRFSAGGGGGKIPRWERQRRYNGWVRSLSPSEQEALARQFYDTLWSQLQAYFGDIGQPPPELVFVDDLPSGVGGRVFQDESGIRQVQLPRSFATLMASRGPGGGEMTIQTITHEWRHVFQNADLYWTGRDVPHDDQPIEQDAINFASQVSQTMAENRRRQQANRRRARQGKPPLPLIQPVPYNPENIAENIGKDPTTISYP